MRQVAIVDPGTTVAELDCFNRMSLATPLPLTYHLPALFGVDSLQRCDDLAGIVVLGSGASVNEARAWQVALNTWLLPRLRDGIPTLGLCYGHQLVAHLLGGQVGPLFDDGRKLRGLRTVSLEATPLWGEATSGPLLVTHREAVLRLPDGMSTVGHSDEVAVDAIAHDQLPIWGLQGHAEATLAFVKNNDVPFDADPSVLSFGHGLVDAFLRQLTG